MTMRERPSGAERMSQFENELRIANQRIHPPDALRQRLLAQMADDRQRPVGYRLTISSPHAWRTARRFALPLAAVLAIGITAPLLLMPRSGTPPTPVVRESTGPRVTPAREHSRVKSSVVVTGDIPTIVRELPTDDADVTIVWLYSAPRPAALPDAEPVGAIPQPQSKSEGAAL